MVNKKSQQKRNDKNKFKKPLCFGSDSEDEEMLNTNNRHRFRLFDSPPRDESSENNEMNSYFTDDKKEYDSCRERRNRIFRSDWTKLIFVMH